MLTGAELVVKCLEQAGVKYIFGIPGAKVDAVFNALVDSSIRLILCRHEQNAAFMAAAYGRLTGSPGVVLVTSGPGIANLTTGLLTATTEGDPVIALGGNVPCSMLLRASHQNANNVRLMEAATKSSLEVPTPESIPEAITNSFRIACSMRRGACFISLPQDILAAKTAAQPIAAMPLPSYNCASSAIIAQAVELIDQAKLPVLLLGEDASRPQNSDAVRRFLKHHPLPVVGTFQAAGVIPRELEHCFIGRVGLFKNQPGDALLDQSDLVITIGYDPVEYDPEVWNSSRQGKLIHLDYEAADIRQDYQPQIELLGDIAETLDLLSKQIKHQNELPDIKEISQLHQELYDTIETGKTKEGNKVHPLKFIYELRQAIDDDCMVVCDIGSVYMWMARYFLCYQPRHLLFSNGQQTLGVAMPWAMAANLVYPDKKILSISGDGGFLFSAMELETAVREKMNFIHFVWSDHSYNMVKEQEVMKYDREVGVELGPVNLVDFARAFGAHGFELTSSQQLTETLQAAMQLEGPVLINVPIDYSDNPGLFVATNPFAGN